jgi:hypothetical protein
MPIMIEEYDDVALVHVILYYLAGMENSLVKAHLSAQCERGIACKERYEKMTARTLTQIFSYEDCVRAILDELSVPKEKQQEYINLPNLYVLLKKLQSKHRHLANLIHLIDETKPPRNLAKPFFFTAVILAGISVLLWFKAEYVERLSLFAKKAMFELLYGLQRALRLVRNTPLLGLLVNGSALIWAWYRAFSDGLGLDHDKAIVLFLKTVENVFPIVGYLLCFFAGGVMTVPALSLFVVGSATDAVEGLYSFVKHELEQWFDPIPDGDTCCLKTARKRVEMLRERDLSLLAINLAATVLITASVVMWCLFPPSWIITVACVVCGWLVGMSKGFAVAHLNQKYANQLQRNLKEITADCSDERNELISSSPLISSYLLTSKRLEQVEKTSKMINRMLIDQTDTFDRIGRLAQPDCPSVPTQEENFNGESHFSSLSSGLS